MWICQHTRFHRPFNRTEGLLPYGWELADRLVLIVPRVTSLFALQANQLVIRGNATTLDHPTQHVSPCIRMSWSVAAGEARLLEILTGLAAKDLSKVLKHPTSFSCQTRDEELVKWPAWAWEFEQYLGTLDKSFQVDFKRLKDNAKTVVDFSVLTEAEKDRSRIMYGLLASLLNDRLKRLLKTVSDNNGYEAYRLISLELRPSSRTRALALMQTIHNWPVFDSKQGLLAQVVRLEQAMAEYDSIASQAMSDDQRVVSLLRCLTGQLRQHVNSPWKILGAMLSFAAWLPVTTPLRRNGERQLQLSKGKQKGGKDGKGKPKGKFDKGKKGKGHFARDCRQSRVRQVEEATDGGASASTVRRVAYNLDDYDAASSGEIRVVSQCDVCEQCNSGDEGDEVKSDGAVSSVCKAKSVCARTLQSRWCVSHNASPSDASDETERAEGMRQQCVAEPAVSSAGSVRMIRSAQKSLLTQVPTLLAYHKALARQEFALEALWSSSRMHKGIP
ncbi:unnamed protein product [Symbiodinium sp. KB8]|nr:unnamed protein product [Symbiodinium sp. KB8]